MSKAPVLIVEETPRLRLGAIRALKTGASGFLGHYGLDNSDLVVHLTRIDDLLLIGGAGISDTVHLIRVQQTFGWATYFQRPEGSGRCTSLFLVAGKLVSSAGCKLVYASQHLSSTARKRQTATRLAERLEASPQRGAPGKRRLARVTKLFGLAEFNEERSRAVLDRAGGLTTATGQKRPFGERKTPNVGSRLYGGRSALELEIAINRLAPGQTLPREGLQRVNARNAPKRGAPELQIRRLMAGGTIQPRWYHWDNPEGGLIIFTVLDPEDASGATLLVDIFKGSAPTGFMARQPITLVGGERHGDLFFRCPVTGERALTLFFREGRFASAYAQKLRTLPRGEYAEPILPPQFPQAGPDVEEVAPQAPPSPVQPAATSTPAPVRRSKFDFESEPDRKARIEHEKALAMFEAAIRSFRE